MKKIIRILKDDIFPALKHRNFRYFWFGQCISLLGTWTQRTAEAWLVYSLTNSPLLLGLLGVFQFGPSLAFSLFAGVLVDRFPKRKLLLITQFAFMFHSLALSLLVLSGRVRYWHVVLLALIFGLSQALDMPSRQAFVVELVGKKDLMNAISLNSTIVNLAKIVGPAVAGILMIKLGVGVCFLVNSISFLPVIYGIYKITANGINNRGKKLTIIKDISEGVKYILNNETLLFTCIFMLIVCTFSANSEVIIPIFAKDVLSGGINGYTFLLSALGIGAFIGAICMAVRSRRGPKKFILIADTLLVSIVQISIHFIKSYYFIAFMILFIGFFYMTFLNMSNSTLQINSSNEYRGRVMSVYTLLNVGTTPIGNAFSGAIMERLGSNMGYTICGIFTLVPAIIVLLAMSKRKGRVV
ncbi:MFS transporter [Clostridium sp. 19966]|uniref:MFS transporter n=1 Tax=Clostridium sp. 19966 TaxID=2768166 RepID=UPI0028DD6423|nr:MFS transporter [Clostridium sp. 19966]MDT8717990.1 MFS transporter [Clostridium sp. 19966]